MRMDTATITIGNVSLNSNTFHTGNELHTAAINGDILTIERFLRKQNDGNYQTINDGDRFGRTALVYTVLSDWFECAEMLVEHGASVLQVDCDKRSVLHWAAYLDRPKYVKLFLDHLGANLDWNVGDKEGRTALHYAAMQPNSKCLRLLLKRLMLNKRSLNTTDNALLSALHWSIFYNRIENVELLIQEAAIDTTKRDAKGRSVLHMAVLNPNADSIRIVRLLLKLNKHLSQQFDTQKRTALHLAVASGNAELARELCTAELPAVNDLDSNSLSVLHYAVLRNDLTLIDILLTAGVKIGHADNTGARVLHYAAKNNNVQILNRLLLCPKFEDSTDGQGRTAVMWAASEGSWDVLNVMLQNLSFFNIHTSDQQGLTALHYACFAGHERCVQLLIANSANVRQIDNLGQTALFKACQQGNRKIIDILMDNTGHRRIIGDINGHEGTIMDRHVMVRGNVDLMGTHLSAILEESSAHLKHSTWSHESSSEENETGDLLPRDEGLLSGDELPRDKGHISRDILPRDEGPSSGDILPRDKGPGKTTGGLIPESQNHKDSLSHPTRLRIDKLNDNNGCTPLHFAAHSGHTPVCRWLLSEGVDPGKKDSKGHTALHWAAFNGHTACLVLILSDHPELVNDRDAAGYSVLHHAASNGHLEAVKLLVGEPYCAFLNFRVKSTDWTPLDFAMAADHQDVTQFLMDNGALTISRLQALAADTIKRSMRRLVIKNGVKPLKALIEKHKKLTKEESLKHRENGASHHDVDIDAGVGGHGNDDVIGAVGGHENDDVIDTVGGHGNDDVIEQEANINEKTVSDDLKSEDDQSRTFPKSESTIHSDQKSGDNRPSSDNETFPFAEVHLCNNSDNRWLLQACYHGNLARVQELKSARDVDVDYRDEYGCTALHHAAAQGHDDVCEYLLQLGADVTKRDIHGRTVLHNASIAGNTECASLLLSNDKHIKSYLDCDKRTALHYAASLGHLDVVKLLLSEDTEVQGSGAQAALDGAILGQHGDVVEFIISQSDTQNRRDRAARVIQRNFRRVIQRKVSSDDKYTKGAKYGALKIEIGSENDGTRMSTSENRETDVSGKNREFSSGIIQTKFVSRTSETDQNSRKSKHNPITGESDEFSEGITPNPGTDDRNSEIKSRNYSKDPHQRMRENRARGQAPRGASFTFAQSNIEQLSRAPESVVVASGKRESIFEVRNNWQRIAVLRRKKHAAILIQRCFRRHLDCVTSEDGVGAKNTSEESGNARKRRDAKQQTNASDSMTQVLENVRISTTNINKNQIRFRTPDETRPRHYQTSEKPKIENYSKSNQNESSSGSHEPTPPKGLARKGVVNRLRTASSEYSLSENEFPREKRQYKSTFPLLSPKSSSTSSNGMSHSNGSSNPLPNNRRAKPPPSNQRVDVALTKTELVNQWLFDGVPTRPSSDQGDLFRKNANRSPAQNRESLQIPDTRSAGKTDPSKSARRMSTQSERIRRDSLVKNVYGSPAALSFNFALGTYHPLASRRGRKETAFPFKTSGRVRPNSMKRVQGGWVRTSDYAPDSSPSESGNSKS